MSDGPPEKIRKVDPLAADVIGWHNMYWSKAQLKVCFRPGGKFFCADPEYQVSDSIWDIINGEVIIDWKQFGKYALSVSDGKNLKGNAFPKIEGDDSNWRKTLYFGSLSPVEKMLFGDGEGTEWDFKHPDGNFSVEFKCDGKNTFVSPYPGAAHWSLSKDQKTIKIDWGRYGQYELDINVKNKTMDGVLITDAYEKTGDAGPKDWRKTEFKRNVAEQKQDNGHGHGHEGHGHDEGAGHAHGNSADVGVEGDDQNDGHGHEHGHGHSHENGHGFGGGIVSLGNMTVQGEQFMIDREDQVVQGTQTTFGVESLGQGKATGLTAWLQDSKGQRLSDPVEGATHGGHLHFTVKPKDADVEMLAIGCGDQVSTISVRPGAFPVKGGILSPLEDSDGKAVGFIELKLHDDAGDLELWLCKDGAMTQPLDFPASTSITATFATHDNRSVELKVRNSDKNEDEDDNPTMRDGKTNYFIFPGESDQDPAFLVGEKFRSTTTLTFKYEGKTYTAPSFVLVPHQ